MKLILNQQNLNEINEVNNTELLRIRILKLQGLATIQNNAVIFICMILYL